MSKQSIKNLIANATNLLYEKQYSNRCIEYTKTTWKQFQKFCDTKGYEEYAPLLNDEFEQELLNSSNHFKPSTIRRKMGNMKMLNLLHETGTWKKGCLNPRADLSTEFKEFIAAQSEYLLKNGYSENTQQTMTKSAESILRFFHSNGMEKLCNINESYISSYVLTLKGHARSTIRGELSRLRSFFTYLYLLEYTPENLSCYVPRYKLGSSQSMVKIWKSNELIRVLETVDCSNPKGKRDAAFITIAAELGVRSIDIRNLKLTDIDWDICSISFTQSKTGHPNALPLSEKVGVAIINYLHVRPETECEYLFVSMNPPYDKMNSFNSAFQTYVSRSGVNIPVKAHHGLHSLRATVATKLLASNVSPDVIFPFLGHSNRESLNSYIRLDINNLRECALSFEDGELI